MILIFENYFLEPDILYVRSFGSKVKTSMQNFVWWAHETLLARTAHTLKSAVMKTAWICFLNLERFFESMDVEKKESKEVYLLWHVHEIKDDYGTHDDEKLIGVFETEEKAKEGISWLRDVEGFKDCPIECFVIDKYEVDKMHWTEGFVTVPIRQNGCE